MNLVLQLPHGIMAFHAGCFSFLQQALGVICGASAHAQHTLCQAGVVRDFSVHQVSR